jgi:hypothetical protein
MDILAVRPELKEMLGHIGKEAQFKQLIDDMKPNELVALNHYLNKTLEQSASNVWSKQKDVRKVENQIQILKEDYKNIHSKLQLIQKDLKTGFKVIFRSPKKAEKKCVQWENVKGLIKTGWTLRNRPSVFGGLKGFSFMGIANSNGRKKAKETAQDLNYEHMKKSFNEGKKIVTWLGHILKGV